jgi:hypothetical protein
VISSEAFVGPPLLLQAARCTAGNSWPGDVAQMLAAQGGACHDLGQNGELAAKWLGMWAVACDSPGRWSLLRHRLMCPAPCLGYKAASHLASNQVRR